MARRTARTLAGFFCLTLAVGWCAATAQAVSIDWATVGDPGNPADTEVMTCCGSSVGTTGYGSVGYTYLISKYETTNAQYAEFLNAVATTDTYGLYDTGMGLPPPYLYCGGITRSGESGSYTYSAIAGRENIPVNWVSFYDALRFANWLHNGQPTGVQDSTTTEDGAYDMSLGYGVVRKAGAKVFLTSEDEWYKAAYYDALSTSYFDYPAGSDTQTTCAMPGATANTANCDEAVGDLSTAGSYTDSASPNGTFDQAGNVWEWNEFLNSGSARGLRAGGFLSIYGPDPYALALASSYRDYHTALEQISFVGFRVASIPGGWFPSPVPTLSQWGLVTFGMLLFTAMAVALRRQRAA